MHGGTPETHYLKKLKKYTQNGGLLLITLYY
jgi:hypothetical protein